MEAASPALAGAWREAGRRGRSCHVALRVLALGTVAALWQAWGAEATTKWHSCSPKNAPVQVENVEMSPDPPVSGHNFTLLLPALTREQLVAGSVQVLIYYYGVPIRSQTEDLCDKARCPVPPGDVVFRHVQSLPTITPAGHYSVRLAAVDSSHTPLFCTDVFLDIVRQSTSQRTPAQADWGRKAQAGSAGGRDSEDLAASPPVRFQTLARQSLEAISGPVVTALHRGASLANRVLMIGLGLAGETEDWQEQTF